MVPFNLKRKNWPLLELLAKIKRVLACSCSQNFCNCSHARTLVNMYSIPRDFVNPINKREIPARGKFTKYSKCSLSLFF